MNQKKTPTITAVILVKDNREMIANCIETVRWCDHILVIDNDSSDGTGTLAEKLGAKVVSATRESFAQLRELALKYVKTDWIFYLDVDERVTPELSKEILVHIETDDRAVLTISRTNIFLGHEFKFGGWQRDLVTRVFNLKNLKGWQGEIHESPVFDGENLLLHHHLIHLTHKNTKENLLKTSQWTKKEAQLLFKSDIPKVTLFTLIRKGSMEILRRAILKKGYKDGLPGMIEAIVQGINKVLIYIQVWELQQNPSLEQRYQQYEQQISERWKSA